MKHILGFMDNIWTTWMHVEQYVEQYVEQDVEQYVEQYVEQWGGHHMCQDHKLNE